MKLDHIAIVVRETEEALKFYRDLLGLPVVLSEVIEEAGVRLTHLDLGNLHLQLVQPLTPEHRLSRHLDEHGEGLHHLCVAVEDVPEAMAEWAVRGLPTRGGSPHRGPLGKKAAFIDPAATRGVLWEMTSSRPPQPDKNGP